MTEPVTCILGADPGLTGALSFYFPTQPGIITAEDIPLAGHEVDAAALARRIVQMRPTVAVIEAVGARPGQGVSSMFKFGQAYGTLIGTIAACGIPLYRTPPTRWKKHFGLGADKEQARARAIALWPTSAAFERKKDHGRAEAALIARFAAEVLIGGGNG